MKKLLEENETLTQFVYDARRPPPRRKFTESISRNFLQKIQLKMV